ncbi:MAG: 2,4-dihydroxyhept-2-ene-1,7-dioic acid aldolase [Rhodospirillales bacterium]|nr:2,4-dihydroxyhept-2-ene-1,7-dioic acid aldolase [Rhodospirillales bacterium]
MRENKLKKIWKSGGTVYCGWLIGDSSYSAEIIANENFDAVVVDMQHGLFGFKEAVEMLQAISTKAPVPLARTQWNEPSPIMRLLDAGAWGIVCPLISTADECEQFIRATRYPPEGERSFGPMRAMLYGGEDYYKKANDTIVTIAMIETAEALDNLDGIMSIKGLDAIFIGPSDLSIALGHEPSLDPKHKEVLAQIERIRKVAVAHGVVPGIHCADGKVARKWRSQGFRFLPLAADSYYLSAGAKAMVAEARKR